MNAQSPCSDCQHNDSERSSIVVSGADQAQPEQRRCLRLRWLLPACRTQQSVMPMTQDEADSQVGG